MKVTFIQSYYENVWEALGLGYIIAYCKVYYKGELEINFFQAKFDDHAAILRGSMDSDIVAFSCTSPAYAHGLHLAKCIKNINPDVHTVFGGWHPTALPEEVIKEPCVDQVVVGEGESALLQILNGDRGKLLRYSGHNHILMPWPDRETIHNERTIDLCETMNGRRTASFQMNRGCKVHCKFCAEQGMTGKYSRTNNPIRSRYPLDVIEEIKMVRDEYNIDYFKFVDATFDVTAATVIEFCRFKEATGLDLEWECNIHPGFVQDEKVFEWLKRANCNQINVGCESGSPKILKDVGKGTSLGQIHNVFKWAKQHGIKRRGYFLLGMPDENFYDHDLTVDLIDNIEPDVVGFTILCPYPGTDFYDHESHKDVDWSKTDEYSNDFWNTLHDDNKHLKNRQEYFLDRYSHLLCERQNERFDSKL
jgi:anaerobic magnesium-protoporphyrin IX monomethyl ester cyclase